MALLMKEDAAKVGFNINVVREPADGYWANVWMKHPFVGSNWMPRPTADLRFSLVYVSEAKWNEASWYHDGFDSLIKEARGVLDGPERHELYCAAQQIMWDEGGSIIPLFTHWLDANPLTWAATKPIRSAKATVSAATNGAAGILIGS